MASKDVEHAGTDTQSPGGHKDRLVGEVADLWFHCMIALAYHGLAPSHVLAELQRREGLGGIEEKSLRKALARERSKAAMDQGDQ
jgi:phosphoribosyl-ATP pyrophosphohydrolase